MTSDDSNPTDELLARAARARKKLLKRVAAIRGDLAKIEEAERLAEKARMLLPEAARAKRGATSLRGTDWTTGETIEIALDPKKSARDSLEGIFARAKRVRRGEPIAKKRLEEAELAIASLDDACRRFQEGEVVDLEPLLPREIRPLARPKEEDVVALPYRAFDLESGRVLVGRGASRNDDLTFRVAKPYHVWMHARGVPGAHVIIPIGRDKSVPADWLIDAAHLAVHFSDARGESIVEVVHAPRKWVRKPRGAAPGLVVVTREKVLVLRVEPDRLARLLAREV